MLEVTNLKVASFSLDHLDLFWETAGSEDPHDYRLEVLRSESELGPFLPITSRFEGGVYYHFRDTTVRVKDPDRRWCYRIRAHRKTDGETSDWPAPPGAAVQDALPDLEALEMARMEQLRLQEFKGRQVVLFQLRSFGARCTTCWDPVGKQRMTSSCPSCFGTSYTGGYHTPTMIWMEIVDPTQSTTTADHHQGKHTVARGRIAAFPRIKDGDLVVEAENKRWRVGSNIRRSEKLRYAFRQEFDLVEIDRSDVAFTVPVKVDAETFQPSPLRQFSNPHSVGELFPGVPTPFDPLQ